MHAGQEPSVSTATALPNAQRRAVIAPKRSPTMPPTAAVETAHGIDC